MSINPKAQAGLASGVLPWLPGGARGGDALVLRDKGQYLVCVRLAGTLTGGVPWLDWHVVEIQRDCDGFVFHTDGGWRFEWSDVQWALPLEALNLPDTGRG